MGECEREREGGVRGRPRIIGETGERLRDLLLLMVMSLKLMMRKAGSGEEVRREVWLG